MSLSHTWSKSVKSDAGTATSTTATYAAGAEENFNDTSPAVGTLEVDIVVDVSQIVSFYIKSDKAVTLKTNSTSSPAQTISLGANKMLGWNSDDVNTCPLTTDVTKLYFVNAGSADAKVVGSFLLDVTV